jgi:predicted nucleic acid-binding protein
MRPLILVIDASVAIAWIATDDQSAYAEGALRACESDRAVVPARWHWEIANTLLVLERKSRVADATAVYASVARNLPISVEDDAREARRIDEIALARHHNLSVYDAAYLALAKSRELALATLDAKLARAAKAEGVFFHATS